MPLFLGHTKISGVNIKFSQSATPNLITGFRNTNENNELQNFSVSSNNDTEINLDVVEQNAND